MSRETIEIWEINREIIKVLVKNTIETYPPEWRLIHEPLQNAIDSFIDEEGNIIDIGDLERVVTIELRIGSNLVIIEDNGDGIPSERFTNFLFLGEGSKSDIVNPDIKKLLKGSQGVGIKSTVFTSEIFKVSTLHKGEKWELDLPNFNAYSNPGFSGEVEVPTIEHLDQPSGTKLQIRLHQYSVWEFIQDRVAEFFETIGVDNNHTNEIGEVVLENDKTMGPFDIIKILLRYFRKESYAGCVSRTIGIENCLPIKFVLKLICDFTPENQSIYQISGIKTIEAGSEIIELSNVEYLNYPNLIQELPSRMRPRIVSDYKQILEAGQRYDMQTVYYQILTKDDFQQLLGKVRKRRQSDPPGSSPNILIRNQSALDKNRTALSRLNGGILFIASRIFLKNVLAHKSSIMLSINGLPTDLILEVTGAELGYIPATHLVLDVDETLGYGKRNLHPRSKGLYNQLAKDLWKTLHKLASYIVKVEEDFDFSSMGHHLKRNEEFAEILDFSDDDNSRIRDIIGRLTLPKTEEDVVTIYFYMGAKGSVPFYKFFRLNDNTIYDSLAFPPGDITGLTELDILTIEFKPTTLQLCKSDEEGRQRFQDIDIAIVWEATANDLLPPGYSCIHKDGDHSGTRYKEGVNYRLRYGRHSVQIIALKDYLDNRTNASEEGDD